MKGVYLVTDRELCGNRGVAAVVAAAARAGACCVQLREKTASTRRFIETAAHILTLLAPYRIPLIINDRIEVAQAVGAHGVHVGQRDMAPETARRLLGPDAIIGLSVETWEDVDAAQQLEVDYLGISPVYATPTKTDTKAPWGLEGVTRIKDFTRHPLVGIGGLDASNAAAVIRAGADCIAVVSAICAASDPFTATIRLKETIENAHLERGF
ncbi:MAG: Thiamin-phosphate pyrophosphorylase (EC 2.5.1.3) [Olavius algarvensis Delta 4 endosymbiont]|nr:MAG: Thiamin-phosphate pyrophosphorylase (EC 2.5.1.3) [Olavius algarvensis Delta 4 endosymbiont]